MQAMMPTSVEKREGAIRNAFRNLQDSTRSASNAPGPIEPGGELLIIIIIARICHRVDVSTKHPEKSERVKKSRLTVSIDERIPGRDSTRPGTCRSHFQTPFRPVEESDRWLRPFPCSRTDREKRNPKLSRGRQEKYLEVEQTRQNGVVAG